MKQNLPSKPAGRLVSLDALRGFTIAAMITVNFPGLHDQVYAPLQHTRWNGLTFTDLIAPIFLFVIGVSIAFAYSRRLAEEFAQRGNAQENHHSRGEDVCRGDVSQFAT